jgi:hypothetical protein
MSDHFELGPSAAHRWMACPGSVARCRGEPNETSLPAEEGLLAHWLLEEIITTDKRSIDLIGHESESRNFKVDSEMLDFINGVMGRLVVVSHDIVAEGKLFYGDYVEGGFGTCDVIQFSVKGDDSVCRITDLKYGRGNEVYAVSNEQMMIYALGVLQKYGFDFDFDTFELVIDQPRRNHYDLWTISVEELETWADEVLIPAAEATRKTDAAIVPGPKQCLFCDYRTKCTERTEYATSLVLKGLDDFDDLDTIEVEGKEVVALSPKNFMTGEGMSSAELGNVLDNLDMVKKWCGDMKDFAITQIKQGMEVIGEKGSYKMVMGKSGNRKWADIEKADRAVQRLKIKEVDRYDKTLRSVKQIEDLIGKDHRILDPKTGYVIKPPGKATLVPASDKREAIDFLAEGLEDFEDLDFLEDD